MSAGRESKSQSMAWRAEVDQEEKTSWVMSRSEHVGFPKKPEGGDTGERWSPRQQRHGSRGHDKCHGG